MKKSLPPYKEKASDWNKLLAKKIDTLCSLESKYPLAVRIAVWLHLHEITEEDFVSWNIVDDIIKLNIHNALRDIKSGYLKITTELTELAFDLGL